MSQQEENYIDPQFGMTGSIKELQPAVAYKVQTDEILTTMVSGSLLDMDVAPIVMEKGWNWMAYPFYEALPLRAAIACAEEGDYIVSQQSGFAECVDGEWYGNLSVLRPGEGYLYKSVSRKPFEIDVFTPHVSAWVTAKAVDAAERTYAVDTKKYPSSLNVIAALNQDDETASDEYAVYAFVGNECRGVGQRVGNVYFITIYGDKAATINFVVQDRLTGQEFPVVETLTFSEGVVGSVKNPYLLTMKSITTSIADMLSRSTNCQIYTIDGMLVGNGSSSEQRERLPKGVYVIDGKKVVVD